MNSIYLIKEKVSNLYLIISTQLFFSSKKTIDSKSDCFIKNYVRSIHENGL